MIPSSLPSSLPSRPVCEGSRRRLWRRRKALGSLARETRFARAYHAWFAWFALFAKTAPGSLAHEARFARTKNACLHIRETSFVARTMLDLLCLLDLRRLRNTNSLAKLASFAQTILDLLDLRRLRLTHSLAKPASTTLGLLCVRFVVCFALIGLCRLRLASSLLSHRSNFTWLRVCLDSLACPTGSLPTNFYGGP